MNDLVSNKMTSNEKFKLVGDTEDDSQRLDRQEDIMEPSKATEVTDSESIKDPEDEFKTFTEGDVNFVPSQPAGESSSSNDMENTDIPENSTAHENMMNKSNLAEDNDSLKEAGDINGKPKDLIEDKIVMDEFINHKITDEPTEPLDSDVKITKPDTSDGHMEGA